MTRIFSLFVLSLLAAKAIAADPPAPTPFTIGPFPEKLVWPISGTATPDPIAYSFGPRRFRSDFRYDFSRGIDIQVDRGTAVRAVAAGEVRIAGKNPAYKQPLVQLRHKKPGEGAKPEYFYTNYMFLDEATVKEGDQVEQGAVIGRSGLSPNGYERLHFEVRDGGTGQAFCVHPLAVLPYPNSTLPKVEIRSVKAGRPHSTVEVRITTDGGEPDFARLDLEFTVSGGEPTRVAYDVAEWNRLYSPKGSGAADPLDQEKLNGLELAPDFFQLGSDYYLTVGFFQLPPAPNDGAIKAAAKVTDARGKTGEAIHPNKTATGGRAPAPKK